MITSARTPGNVSCPLMGMADQSYYAGDGLNKTLLTPALGLGLSAARSQPGPQWCTLRTRFEAGRASPFSVRPPGSTFLSAETAGQSRGRDRVWLARDGNRRECCRLTSENTFSALRRNTRFPSDARSYPAYMLLAVNDAEGKTLCNTSGSPRARS